MRAAIVLAAALAAAPLAAQEGSDLSLGQADPAPAPSGRLLVIDRDRVLSGSERGRAMLGELEAATAALEGENRGIEARLRAEERDLTERRPGMDPEAFRAEAEAFDARVRRIREDQLAKGREILAREEALQRRFWDEAVPILGAILQERGAVVVLDRESVFLSADSADITAEAIARIDAAPPPRGASGTDAPAVTPGGGLTAGGAPQDEAAGPQPPGGAPALEAPALGD